MTNYTTKIVLRFQYTVPYTAHIWNIKETYNPSGGGSWLLIESAQPQ